ncbi:hypothetical protein BOX15_Mlig009012g1 [Macrostomum lignano]|uniref:RING-type domain-containing protein n=1 Tax=Macrostomum lignano TaxID=282301 RepID=A0A267EG57_9PLAT|nr:hypothetical protein BOX15_Mlig009012g1 [Macrostomum lignano]
MQLALMQASSAILLCSLMVHCCIADTNSAPKSLSSAAANGQPRAQRSDELVVKLDCQPALAGQPVAYRIEFRQTSDCTNAATITMTGTRQDRFDSLGAAPVSAATWWLFRLGELPQQAGTEPSLPLLTVKMMPNCSGLTVKPLKSTAGIGDYAVLADASGCSIVRVLTLLPKLLSNTRGRCLLYGIQGANSVGDVESGDAADMCILIQEHGYSNRRSLFGELRADNRTCSAAASASVGNGDSFINRVSVVFVSVSFVLLVAISVSWIVFYYVQRFRYRHAKKRLSQRLCNAAKTALSKIPVRILQLGDDAELQWIGDHCAVCIEPYGCGDPVRILPCKHKYHTHCIDQWLLDQRSCPLCKTDILKACGLWVSGGSRISLDDVTITPAASQQPPSIGIASTGASAGATAAAANRNNNNNNSNNNYHRHSGGCVLHHHPPDSENLAVESDPPENPTGADPLLSGV